MKTIELLTLDKNGYELDRRDFDTIKEAKEAVKPLLTKEYWNRRSETQDGWREVETIQLLVDGEVHTDWFPEFSA